MAPANWWKKFFDDDFRVLLDRENDVELEPTVDFLQNCLNLSGGSTIYDQCCGTGAVTLAFARRGIEATGVDQAETYIDKARERAKADRLDLRTHFYAADAFDYIPPNSCDAAINWYSSFGYSPDDAQNIKMFERLYDSVRPGGRVAVEYMHIPQIIANFRENFTRSVTLDGQPVELEKRTTLDHARGMIASQWTYHLPDGQTRTSNGESRMYDPQDIGRLLRDSGFKNLEFFGGIGGESLTQDSPRVICTALRP